MPNFHDDTEKKINARHTTNFRWVINLSKLNNISDFLKQLQKTGFIIKSKVNDEVQIEV